VREASLDLFDLAGLDSALAGTIFAGNLHFFSVTDSTNADALEAARGGAPHGSIYFTDEQLAGRGRGGHDWHSPAGDGLYVSVLLRPAIPAARLPLLPLAAGLAASALRAGQFARLFSPGETTFCATDSFTALAPAGGRGGSSCSSSATTSSRQPSPAYQFNCNAQLRSLTQPRGTGNTSLACTPRNIMFYRY